MDYAGELVHQMTMVTCPACGSPHCSLQTTAYKTGVAIGGILGDVVAASFNGATIAGIVSRRLPTTVTGAIVGAIIGFAWGAVVGRAGGTDSDDHVLGMYQCRECGFEFKT
ncbi:hypothetical protein [Acidocella sp.]|uniref:hypothetical protein n=1 Tax=Acidocella sp. TaxID=50710 RepID=UPI0026302935|nr:hypothetical protein [Acidocella sp.]